MAIFNTAIFDLDGVIVDTARYHYLAWKRLSGELGFEFTESHNELLKGVSRMKSLEILLEIGNLQFDEEAKNKMAEKKNQWYVEYIKTLTSEEVLPGVEKFLTELRSLGIKTAVGSASKNAVLILNNLGLMKYFDVVIDGNCITNAKPEPDVFLRAAEEVGAYPSQCVVFEDAEAGIKAAKRAGMYVVGVGSETVLNKANMVIGGFDDAACDYIIGNLYTMAEEDHGRNWIVPETGHDTGKTGYYETIFTLTNGYLGIRGVKDCFSDFFRKGTFIAGVFDKSEARVTELVNCPDFFNYDIYIESEKLDFNRCRIISYKRELDMKRAILNTEAIIEDKYGRCLKIDGLKMVSMAEKHVCGFTVKIVPMNFSGNIIIESEINAEVTNIDFQSMQDFKHYSLTEKEVLDNQTAVLKAKTNDESIELTFYSQLSINPDNEGRIDSCTAKKGILQSAAFKAEKGKQYGMEKLVFVESLCRKEEFSVEKSLLNSAKAAFKSTFDQHLMLHIDRMEKKWAISDIIVEGDDGAQLALRYNILNLIMLGPDSEKDVSIGAKGLHGEGYKGHIFWDTEIFLLPFYIYNDVENAKKLLLYRYNRLKAAKENAVSGGLDGAQFPWESAASGREVTPKIIYTPDGTPYRCWTGDEEIHVTGDVAFAFYEFYRITGDRDFYFKYCGEVLLETAKFWESRLSLNEASDLYEIKSVIGPDEFHVHVDNDFYTNYLAKWNLLKAVEIWNEFKVVRPEMYNSLKDKTGLTDQRVSNWEQKADKVYIPSMEGVIEQSDGFFKLKDYEIVSYKPDGMPALPSQFKTELDFEGYQLIKQPDVIMIMHLFNQNFTDEQKSINYEYYEKRTTHISSLSPSICCLMGIDIKNTDMACKYFDISANADLHDNQGNTKHGIHAASLGGTWQAAVFGFGGFRVKNDEIHLSPWLPDSWSRLEYRVNWQGRLVSVKIFEKKLSIRIDRKEGLNKFSIVVNGIKYLIPSNVETSIQI